MITKKNSLIDAIDKVAKKEKLKQEMFQALKDYYFQGHDYKVDPRKRKFRCSQLGKSSRKLVFTNILGWDSGQYMNIATKGGTVIHTVIQNGLGGKFTILTNTDLKIEDTVSKSYMINDEIFDVKGHVDLLVMEFDGVIWVIDIKTTDNLQYIIQYGAKSDHQAQVIFYVDLLQFTPEQMKIVQPALLYQYRRANTGDIFDLFDPNLSHLVEVPYNPGIEQRNIQQMTKIYNAVNNGKLPEIDAEAWECQNKKAKCQYWNFCYDKDGNPNPIMDLEYAIKNAESFKMETSELTKKNYQIEKPDKLICPECNEDMIRPPGKKYYIDSNHYTYPDLIKNGVVKERKWKK